ncbi:MAG: beta-galactosidase [Candidatus Hydrogenedentes bacterium]|nr:beta-galactosidase [Candidatus Hydrogenedentota bacterium]
MNMQDVLTTSLALLFPLMAAAQERVTPLALPAPQLDAATVQTVDFNGAPALEARCTPTVPWPHVLFSAGDTPWDWSSHAGVRAVLHNPGGAPLMIYLRVDNAGADGLDHCITVQQSIEPGKSGTVSAYFSRGDSDFLWGMRGVPVRGPVASGAIVDPSKITAFQFFLNGPYEEQRFLIERVELFGEGAPLETLVPLPFVDRFGQYMHAEWPGKLHGLSELQERRTAEEAAFTGPLPDRDAFGGWTAGPKLEATGWFRTEKHGGKWWLVTPEGRLFFSFGVDCVNTGDRTFVERRAPWFEWLPSEDEAPFAALYAHVSGAHSMADPIGGAGRTFSFYQANLLRKYGGDWWPRWRGTAYARLQQWGFNTIANWSDGAVLQASPLPFVASGGTHGVPAIEGATGYWAKMVDVYDPAFEAAADRAAGSLAAEYGANPKCIGYFIDNELAWEGVKKGVLRSPVSQPARAALAEFLRQRYRDDIAAFNAAWGIEVNTWNTPGEPPAYTETIEADLDAFLKVFAERYFSVYREAFRRHTPNQLYLGCRFSTMPGAAVRACAAIADVVSFNVYRRKVPAEFWLGEDGIDKPILIGEFHFGARDRGMFHTGLVPVDDQSARGDAYSAYIASALAHPNIVGCHWFQYVDEPITGRHYDGENYNIGFVDVTDTPYPELSAAAKVAHQNAYTQRMAVPSPPLP